MEERRGGHADHVHVSFSDPDAAIAIIRIGQKLGLRVTENPYVDKVDPVHTDTSFHYRNFPDERDGRTVGMAIDVSGASELMMRFFQAVRSRYL